MRKNPIRNLTIMLVIVIASAGAAIAQSNVTLSGQVQLTAIPDSLQPNVFQNDSTASLFLESSNLSLESNVLVDAYEPGTYASTASLTPGVIATGTVVSDYLFHADPVAGTGTSFAGSISFSGYVLGVIVLSADLSATDSIFGVPGVSYAQGDPLRGLELAQDHFSISADQHTVMLDVNTWNDIDEFRIITGNTLVTSADAPSTPEPGTSGLMAIGVLSAIWFAHRRMKTRANGPSPVPVRSN